MQVRKGMECGAYHHYNLKDWDAIGRLAYASQHSVAAAAKLFSKKCPNCCCAFLHCHSVPSLSVYWFCFPVKHLPNNYLPDDVIHLKATNKDPLCNLDRFSLQYIFMVALGHANISR